MLATRKRPSPSYSEATRPKRARLASLPLNNPSTNKSSTSRHVPRSPGRCATGVASPATTSACLPGSRSHQSSKAESSPLSNSSDSNASAPYTSSSTDSNCLAGGVRSTTSEDPPPSAQQARLEKQYKDAFDRVWSGEMVTFQCHSGPFQTITRFGLWTGSRRQFTALMESHPDLRSVYRSVHRTGQFHEIFSHPAFFNKVNPVIDATLDRVDHIFEVFRAGALPSTSLHDSVQDTAPISSNCLVDFRGHATETEASIVDEIFNTKRDYITASSTTKTRLLIQRLRQYWGLYFTYATTSSSSKDDPTAVPESPDLDLALRYLKRSSKAADAPDGDRIFSALYLARILVLSQLLDSLPDSLSETQAREEWLHFQLNPPRTSSGDDIFSTVFSGIIEGDAADLRRAAECRLGALGWRNHKWFSRSLKASYTRKGAIVSPLDGKLPPFYLAVDEVTAGRPESIGVDTREVRRAYRRRAAVHTLFSRPDPQ